MQCVASFIVPKTFDLSVKNPNGGEEITHRSPEDIMEEIARGDAESAEILERIKALLAVGKVDALHTTLAGK